MNSVSEKTVDVSVLCHAAETNDTAQIQQILDAGVDPGMAYDALFVAAQHGQAEVVALVLEHEKRPELITLFKSSAWGPLHAAVYFGHAEVVTTLLAHGHLAGFIRQEAKSLLYQAVSNDHLDVAALLLDKVQYAPQIDNPWDQKVLFALLAQNNQELVSRLFQASFDVNATSSKTGGTLLHAAVSENVPIEVVQQLVAMGVDARAKDNQGQTALNIAVHEKHYELAAILFEYGE